MSQLPPSNQLHVLKGTQQAVYGKGTRQEGPTESTSNAAAIMMLVTGARGLQPACVLDAQHWLESILQCRHRETAGKCLLPDAGERHPAD